MCHPAYAPCFSRGLPGSCECEKNYLDVLEDILVIAEASSSNIKRGAQRVSGSKDNKLARLSKELDRRGCLLIEKNLEELRHLVECFQGRRDEDFLRRHCPKQVVCEERALSRIFSFRDVQFSKPDILIIKTQKLTLLIEIKGGRGESPQRFMRQLEGIYDNLPNNYKSPCNMVVLYLKEGARLPEGFARDNDTSLLKRDAGGRHLFYHVPILVVERKEARSRLHRYFKNRQSPPGA